MGNVLRPLPWSISENESDLIQDCLGTTHINVEEIISAHLFFVGFLFLIYIICILY